MAKAIVVCVRSFEQVIPATELVSVCNGVTSKICDVPEKRFVYAAGEQVVFRAKKDAQAFVKAHKSEAAARGEAAPFVMAIDYRHPGE